MAPVVSFCGKAERVVKLLELVLMMTLILGSTQTVLLLHPVQAAFPGDNGKIAFTRQGQIYVMNADGSDQTRLTSPGSDGGPRWSPDGKKIIFVSDQDGVSGIYVMNADGSAQTQLKGGAQLSYSFPSWSPDGSKILFLAKPSADFPAIFVMNIDGSAQTQLTNSSVWHMSPAWSPDGSRVAFVSYGSIMTHTQIFVMNSDGSGQTDISYRPEAYDRDPSWSPDGSKIAFVREGEKSSGIYVMNADGSGQTQLTSPGSDSPPRWFDSSPAWSPDGKQIVFESNGPDNPNYNIYVMNADGTSIVRLTNNPAGDHSPDWQPVIPSTCLSMVAGWNVSIHSSKSSYVQGETIRLSMSSSVSAQYGLTIKKPDGTTWASAVGELPSDFTAKATAPFGTFKAELVAYYYYSCGLLLLRASNNASTSFSVVAGTYDVTISIAGLPGGATTPLQVDGSKVADMKGSDTRVISYPIGTSHSFQVDQYVSTADGEKYYCAANTWTASAQGSHVFEYETVTSPPQAYSVSLSVAGLPADMAVRYYLDGLLNGTTKASAVRTLYFPFGSKHAISVDMDLSGGNGARYDCPDNMWSVSGAGLHTFIYRTQYDLQISCDPVGVFSPYTLWFDADSTAEFVAPEGTNGTDARQVFVEWAGDYSGTNVRGSVLMDGPKSVTAKYKAQYKLSVVFDPPETAQRVVLSNTTWYDAGQSAALGPVPQIISIPESPAERFAWFSWNIDNMTQPGTSVEIPMNSPHSVRLIYQRQYYLLVKSAFGEPIGTGWYVSGQIAQFGVTYGGSEPLVKATLAGWRLDSSNVIETIPPTETEVIMDRPYVIEAQWATDYTPMWVFIIALVSAVVVFAGVMFTIVKRPRSLRSLRLALGSGFGRRKIAASDTDIALSRRKSSPPPTRFCQHCGFSNPPYARAFCVNCGSPLEDR